MGELTFKSAGVKTREIDLSQPRRTGPVGIPAGIIGTSLEGPAFIPLTFANYSDYATTFGASNGENFGPMAVNQWLTNAQSVTFMRVLGAGDGKQSENTGKVNNAGFVVGDEIVQSNNIIGSNQYAVNDSDSVLGRTYFLGCFMSESLGSTIFSSAGLQTDSQAAPVLRGVLLAPSGVILHLSNSSDDSSAPLKTDGASKNPRGGIAGSVDLGSQDFVLLMNGYSNSDASKSTAITASFDMTSPNYFGNVFNKDPLKIEESGHLLYSQYDIYPDMAFVTGSGVVKEGVYENAEETKERIGLLLTSSLGRGVGTVDVPDFEGFESRFSHSKTPFVISQNFGSSPKDLFRIHTLSDGDGMSEKLKFSIENIRKSSSEADKYGKFDLLVRRFNDTDEEPVVLESFRGLSLNPSSDRYLGKIVGDQHVYFDFETAESNQKIVVRGSYPVRSRYIRLEISSEVDEGSIDPEALPMGYRGYGHTVTSGNILSNIDDTATYDNMTAKLLVEPPVPVRESLALGTGLYKRIDKRLYWGTQTTRKTDPTQPNLQGLEDESIKSFVKHYPGHRSDGTLNFFEENNPGAANRNGSIVDCDRFNYNKFTLENIKVVYGSDGLADPEMWQEAVYVRNGNITHDTGASTRRFNVDDLSRTSNIKFAKFTFLAQGGFDGSNIFNKNKATLSNTAINQEMNDGEGVADNTVSCYRKAIDIMASKEDVDIQLLATPGIRNSAVTDYAIQKIEQRFDAMYIMDIEERDQLNNVVVSSDQKPHVANTVASFKNRSLDTSFAAAYFPDVVVTDPDTGALVQVPPSVSVLGAYSLNDRVAHPWFAPAGFTRGALNTVEMASVRLNRENLDDLYEADINPIADFPGAGITIWGQKTLQAANSALDRVNVRRLVIDIRRKVKNIANTLLFEPNREETLERFSSMVNPILQKVQEQSGVERYKAVIDTTTTTQADVENNTIRGKIYIQPSKSIEFVALDFVVTNAGSNI